MAAGLLCREILLPEVRASQINRHPEKNLAIGPAGQTDPLARGIECDAWSNLVLHTGKRGKTVLISSGSLPDGIHMRSEATQPALRRELPPETAAEIPGT